MDNQIITIHETRWKRTKPALFTDTYPNEDLVTKNGLIIFKNIEKMY